MTTAACVLLCRVRVTGTPREPIPHPVLGDLSTVAEDGGVADELRAWLRRAGINPVSEIAPAALITGATFDALFTPADARRVMQWLSARGVHPPTPPKGE